MEPVTPIVIGLFSRQLVKALVASVLLRAVGTWLIGVADIVWEASAAFLGASIALVLSPPGTVGGLARSPWLLTGVALGVLALAWWVRSRLTGLVQLARQRVATSTTRQRAAVDAFLATGEWPSAQ